MAINNRRNNNNKNHPYVRLKRLARLYYLRLLRINDPPERIARGAAIGVLMGILPTFGLGTVLSFIFAFIFKANKAAAIIGSFIMNPLTSAFFWTMSIVLGSLILGEDYNSLLATFKNESFVRGAGWTYVVFLTGNVVISTVCTIIAYFAVKASVIKHREAKRLRRLERAKNRVEE